MKTILILRVTKDDNRTIGILTVLTSANKPIFTCMTLERPWLRNQAFISSIPTGSYDVVKEWSPRFDQQLWEVKGVPDRSEIKFHPANRVGDLRGCIGLGARVLYGKPEGTLIMSSKQALKDFHTAMGTEQEVKLIINNQ